MHFAIISEDDAQIRVLVGAAERQDIDVTVVPPSTVSRLARTRLDGVILDEECLSAAVGIRLQELRRIVGRVHVFLLLEELQFIESDPGALEHERKRALDLGVCLVQHKPFHPSEFFRVAIRTIAQEEAGMRQCPSAAHAGLAGPRADGR